MKSFIVKSLLFLLYFALFFVIVNASYTILLIKTDYNFKKRIETLKFENPDYKLLGFGASTMLDALDAELLCKYDIKSYNLAIDGNTVKGNLVQLKEYLEVCNVTPKYVVLGLNTQMVRTFDEEFINPIVEITSSKHEFKLSDAPILKLKWLGFEFVKKIVSKSQRKSNVVLGQLRISDKRSDNTSYKNQYLDLNDFESSYWIGKMAKLCSKNSIEFIIIEMPGFKETQNLSEIGPYELSFNNGSSATLYNFASKKYCEIYDCKHDWVGNSHLNEKGAIKFTHTLINYIN